MSTVVDKIEQLRSLHRAGCFVIPNPWDVGSAVFLEHLGFRALATTSAGLAFSRAQVDAPVAVPLEATLAHVAQLAAATAVPVSADFQGGFADDPEGVGRNVTRCLETGVAGLSIEDATGVVTSPLLPRDEAVARVRAARAAIDAAKSGVVLTGRCEAFLVGDPTPLRTVLDRLVAYADAGADCLFAPGVRAPDDIRAIVRAVAPKPVNVLVASWAPPSNGEPAISVAHLADLGVRRVSVGSALARVAWGAFARAAREIADGSFAGLAEAASFAELNAVFAQR